MFTKLRKYRDDLLALIGLGFIFYGLYLWLGWIPVLIMAGLVMLFVAWRAPETDL
jgi:hypothetical protein